MVRKVSTILCALALIMAFAMPALGATHQVYDGSLSNTYITYFRDILPNLDFDDHYVCFRSGQYQYMMVAGDLSYDGQTISLDGIGTRYTFTSDNSYGSYYHYNASDITSFSLNVNDSIIYSDLGVFPQLEERGQKYEILTAVLVGVLMLGIAVGRFFRTR